MKDVTQPSRRAVALACVAFVSGIVRVPVALAKPPGHSVRIGILTNVPGAFDPESNPFAREFVAGLNDLGYTPGRDVVLDYKTANGDSAVLPLLAAELANSKPDMLVTTAAPATLAAAKATKTVPIIMVGAPDVVETGLVASLAHPGGNITGLAINAAEVSAKRVQLLQEAVPHLSRVGVLWNASLPGMALGFQNIEKASPQLGLTIQSVRVTGSDQFDQAFATIESGRPEGLVVLYGPLRDEDLPRIVDFVTRRKLPTIFELGQGIRGGGLMEFGPDRARMFRRAAAYVDKIANGADPATLPIEEPSEFELVINLKAANSMGFEVPHSLLLRADRVIE